MNDQILNGLGQDDLDSLASDGRIPDNSHIDSSQPIWLQGEPGLSSGLKHSVQAVKGKKKVIPIFDQLGGGGGNTAEFHIVGWGVVTVMDSHWKGANNVDVTVRKSHALMGELRPAWGPWRRRQATSTVRIRHPCSSSDHLLNLQL